MQVRNSITLIGNLGNHPETSTLPSGRAVTEFSLATNDYYKDKEGNRQTRTEWHKIKAYGKLAEVFNEHLEKGSQVCIAGALRYGKWIDKHDQVRVSAEIIADSFTFLSGGRQATTEETTSEPEDTQKKPAKKRARKSAPAAEVIPF